MDQSDLQAPFRPVIVAERGPEPEQGRGIEAQIGYEVSAANGFLLFDTEALDRFFPKFEAMYAETSAGEIWRFHRNGHLTPAVAWHNEVHTPSPHDGFRIGRADLRFSEDGATVTRIVVTTRDWQDRTIAEVLCEGRRSDLKTLDRIARSTKGARYEAAGNPIVALGTGLDGRARYGEQLQMLDRPQGAAPYRGVGLHGEHSYAFLRTTTTGRDGKRFATWHLVTAEFASVLPLRIGSALDPTATNPAVVDLIYGVVDPMRRNGISPMSARPISSAQISDVALGHLTNELGRSRSRHRSVA